MKNAQMKSQDKFKPLLIHSAMHSIPMYRSKLEVMTTKKMDEVCQRLEFEGPEAGCDAITHTTSLSTAIIFDIDARVTHGTICHEIFHALAHITADIGFKYDSRWHEEYAYLQGYLAELVYGDLKKWGVKIC